MYYSRSSWKYSSNVLGLSDMAWVCRNHVRLISHEVRRLIDQWALLAPMNLLDNRTNCYQAAAGLSMEAVLSLRSIMNNLKVRGVYLCIIKTIISPIDRKKVDIHRSILRDL